jgi:hypothetical protein
MASSPTDAPPVAMDRCPHGRALESTSSSQRSIPRRAVASFENLVVPANYEEHFREARKMVWRDRGQPAVELQDLWECIEHGARGGLRACKRRACNSMQPSNLLSL